MFDALRYLRDRRIKHVTAGKDTSAGWLGVSCPLCRDPEQHGGFSLADGHYNCWRCGGHPVEDVVMALERCEWHEACAIVIEYTDHGTGRRPPQKPVLKQIAGSLSWPPGTMPLQAQHKAYLAGRRFDPDFLAAKYGLMGTGPVGPYAWRVMAPVLVAGRMVSYQGRDITGRADLRYKACRKELELRDHKTVLYNADNAGDSVVVVEGVFDVWRLGHGAVATMGTSVTRAQVAEMGKFRKVFVLSDPEPEAQAKAGRLCAQLAVLGVQATNVILDSGDPADMAQGDADKLKEELLGWV